MDIIVRINSYCKVNKITLYKILERSKRVTMKGDEPEKKDEEDWPLKDVIFVEDVKNFPVGRSIIFDFTFDP